MRSPQADDGDVVDVVAAVAPDVVLLVADAGLGTFPVAFGAEEVAARLLDRYW